MKKTFIIAVLAAMVQTTFAAPAGWGVPDSGSTALLLVGGLGGIAWISRRLRR
jgi:hypothetical protein